MHEYSDILKSGKNGVVFYLLKPINEGLKIREKLKTTSYFENIFFITKHKSCKYCLKIKAVNDIFKSNFKLHLN